MEGAVTFALDQTIPGRFLLQQETLGGRKRPFGLGARKREGERKEKGKEGGKEHEFGRLGDSTLQ